MATKPTPRKKPTPAPAVDRAVVHPIAAGLGVARVNLFSMPIATPGWQTIMLTHIEAAKALGFSMFEIDTAETMIPKPKPDVSEYSFASFLMRDRVTEGEEWQKAKDAGEMVKATVVTIYALVVE